MNFQAFTPEYLESLYGHALHCVRSGVSVIPVWGDLRPDNPKAAAIEWKEYQHRPPTESVIRNWFLDSGFGGLAAPQGYLSNRVCLEFDNPELVERFVLECPNLLDTQTELSAGRRLPHYFYTPPKGQRLHKRGRAGEIELLGEGQYVIIAPTVIAGREYLRQGGAIQQLTDETWQQLIDFIDRYAPSPEQTPYELLPAAAITDTGNWLAGVFTNKISTEGGRNNALFATACFARDIGYSSQIAKAELIDTFITAPAPPGHRPQSEQSRLNEALRTIASAYKMRPRQRLPNSVREHLLQTDRGQVARLIDMLLLHYRPGQHALLRDVLPIAARFGMGNKTALKTFSELKNISNRIKQDEATASPVNDAASAPNTSKSLMVSNCTVNTFCIPFHAYVSVQKDTIRKSSNRANTGKGVFLPQIEALCTALGVENKGGDVIPVEGLKKLTAYRDCLETAYLKRGNETYASRSAKRLGVNRSTAHRRLDRIGAGKKPQEPKTDLITPDEIGKLPCLADIQGGDTEAAEQYAEYKRRGMYLEIDTGRTTYKRAPTAENAQTAWASGFVVSLCKPMPIIRTAPAAQIIRDEIAQPEPLAKAVGAEYMTPAPAPTSETVIAGDPLLTEGLSLGGVLTETSPQRPRERSLQPVSAGQGIDTMQTAQNTRQKPLGAKGAA